MTMKTTEQIEVYKSADLALVAVLLLFIPDSLEVCDRTNPHKVLFAFKKSDELDELVAKYWKRELKVEPQAFFNQLKLAKVRIYAHE
ncbi:MAG: hypothetical protein HYZ69_02705 [Candidatus Colwellbacteria bacterium]|nr:hypothetical protein [Candidatus Colwellbacteria bacterium]